MSDTYDEDEPKVVDVDAEHGEPNSEAPEYESEATASEEPGPAAAPEGLKWQVVWGPGRKPQPTRGWLVTTLVCMLLVGHGYRMGWDGARWFHLFDPSQALLGFLYGGIIFGICHLAWVLVSLLPRGASGIAGLMVFVTIAWLGTQSCSACVFGPPAGEQGPMGGFMTRLGVASDPVPEGAWEVVVANDDCRLERTADTGRILVKTVQLIHGPCRQAFEAGDEVHLMPVDGRQSLVLLPDHTPVGQVYEIK